MSLTKRLPVTRALLAVVVAAGLLAAGPAATAVGAASAPTGNVRANAAEPRSFPYNIAQPPTADLAGLSCLSVSFCMAVGGFVTPGGRGRALAQEWNGHAWRILYSASTSQFAPSGVSCTSTTFCMAVGSNAALRWDGRRWRPLSGSELSGMTGVSCTSPGFCMAVGTDLHGEANLS